MQAKEKLDCARNCTDIEFNLKSHPNFNYNLGITTTKLASYQIKSQFLRGVAVDVHFDGKPVLN
jgi:hypothetical protein